MSSFKIVDGYWLVAAHIQNESWRNDVGIKSSMKPSHNFMEIKFRLKSKRPRKSEVKLTSL